MSTLLLAAVLGVVAGALTTLAGVGGGLVMLLSLSVVLDPITALAATAPALVVGNLHRALICRRSVDAGIGLRFAAGAVPGAAFGAFLAGQVPADAVRWLLAVATVLSIARTAFAPRRRIARAVVAPAGFAIGALTGSTGGAGMLAGPLLLASGLAGEPYVATAALCGTALQGGRLVGYGLAGLLTTERLGLAAVLTVALVAGNQLGRRGQALLERLPPGLVEHGVLAVCVVLALAGLGR